jgi:quercetin dioxygenase-like cupin family protein
VLPFRRNWITSQSESAAGNLRASVCPGRIAMASVGTATCVRKNEGKALWFLGSLFNVKAGGAETDGSLSVVEMTFAPKQIGAPPHRHDCGEAAYVLEGSIRFHVGDVVIDAQPGDFLFFPPGTLEWPENVTDKPAKELVIYTRPAMADFFAAVAEPAKSDSLPPSVSEADFARLAATSKKYGLEFEPPPGK